MYAMHKKVSEESIIPLECAEKYESVRTLSKQ